MDLVNPWLPYVHVPGDYSYSTGQLYYTTLEIRAEPNGTTLLPPLQPPPHMAQWCVWVGGCVCVCVDGCVCGCGGWVVLL